MEGHDSETSFVTTHAFGDFHRPIKGGTYTFTFAKQGYYPQSVQVTVADDQRVDLNIQLEPNFNLAADFAASTTNVALGQSISFTDTSEGMVSSWSWTFEGATPSTSTLQNPTGITYNTPGDYSVTLTVTSPNGNVDTMTKENYIHVNESFNMQNGTLTTCSGLFYDSGGSDANYSNSLDLTMTFYPGSEDAKIKVAFSSFETENNYDYLYIYDGTSTSATQIGSYCGTNTPGTVTATNADGALTFRFTSDYSVNKSGWVASVSCVYPMRTITATPNPIEGGTIQGAGTYAQFDPCTLIATPADGYAFINWTEGDVVVSNEPTYSFDVTANRNLVANFEEIITTVTQISTLNAGWNWWTPNVDITLEQLEAALGSNGIVISNQNSHSVSYHPVYGWGGDLTVIEAGKMYEIQASTSCTLSFEGEAIDPSTHTITLSPGENWIGFFGTQAMSINDALVNLSATPGDVISAQDGSSATYSATYGWGGDLNTLQPGQAYTYNSKATSDKTFSFSN